MAKFFRKFRMQAINKSVTKYLLYALGEITLIIIGILIAMKINNLNEIGKNEAKVKAILIEIQHDLENDILEATQLIQRYEMTDSLIKRVEQQQVTREDYQNLRSGYASILTSYQELAINENGYQSLIRHLDNMPERYAPLLADLNNIYLNDKRGIDHFNKQVGQYSSEVLEGWAKKYTWFSAAIQLKLTKEAIDYFLKNPFYQNELAIYKTYAIGNLLPATKIFKHDAIMLYKKIAELVNPEKALPTYISSYVVDVPEAVLRTYVGTYTVGNSFSLKVTLEDHQLFVQGTGQPKLKVFAKSERQFFPAFVDAKFTFNKDEHGKVVGLTLHQHGQQIAFNKAN
ncbi:MAG: DUF6090 family protein [Flammeovirgaceae bacterium]